VGSDRSGPARARLCKAVAPDALTKSEIPMTRCVFPAFVVVLFLSSSSAGDKDDAKKDQKALQGAWKIVSSESGGMDSTELFKDAFVVFEGDTFVLKKGDEVGLKGTFKIDPSKKPRAIDITITEGGEGDKGKVLHGIYELGKDTLKWCTSGPGATDRPKEFSTKEGVNHMLVTLKKGKP
jgi:uncharacterized protein (TIGR03067 family)